MDSSTAQEMGSQRLENCMLGGQQQEKKAKGGAAADMQAQKCPRCDSTNTKFCYYNNYSLSQPRYFCKSCRRYWTKGGTLRNVPVGGGCRKNKRSSSSSRPTQEQQPSFIPSFSYESNDLSLAIATLQKQSSTQLAGGLDEQNFSIWGNPNMPQHPGGILGNFGTNYNALFQETPAQNLYYGNNGNLEMGMGMSSQGMGVPFDDFGGGGGGAPTATTASTAVTTVKQEMCGGGREGESRVLWGFPWQNGGGGGDGAFAAAPEFDSGRVNWSGIGSTNWHGLLNSPLM